jgi:hypothetical protein
MREDLERSLVIELSAALAGEVPFREIDDTLEQADRGLRGSVSVEALAEMASRLAYHRLSDERTLRRFAAAAG